MNTNITSAPTPEEVELDNFFRNSANRAALVRNQGDNLQKRWPWSSVWDKLDRYGPNPEWGWGRYHCQGSGSWVRRQLVKDAIDDLCPQKDPNWRPNGFDYDIARVGTSEQLAGAEGPNIVGQCKDGDCTRNGAPTKNVIYFTYQPGDKPERHSGGAWCRRAIEALLEKCVGDNDDTRGGYFIFDDFPGPNDPNPQGYFADRSLFGFDPTSLDDKHV